MEAKLADSRPTPGCIRLAKTDKSGNWRILLRQDHYAASANLRPHGGFPVEFVWLFYWLIAAVVLAPVVLIVKGVMANKGKGKGE
jgi:hypothetical protein